MPHKNPTLANPNPFADPTFRRHLAKARAHSAALSAPAALAQLASQQGYLLVDDNTPLQAHPGDFVDRVHPNAAGYTLMEKALASVVVY